MNILRQPRLIKNSYMDDICDSVDTVKQAKKITQNIDKVLESGGFAVKGWTSNKAFTETQNLKIGFKTPQGRKRRKSSRIGVELQHR